MVIMVEQRLDLPPESNADLVKKARNDPEAFGFIYQRYNEPLFDFITWEIKHEKRNI